VQYLGWRNAAASSATEVLVIAVARSMRFVPCIVDGKEVFFLRIGDSTVAAPEYLVTDLVLGRRHRPELQIRSVAIHKWSPLSPDVDRLGGPATPVYRLTLDLYVENQSLVFADDVSAGAVIWGLYSTLEIQAPRYLYPYVKVHVPPRWHPHDRLWEPSWVLAHARAFNAEQGAGHPVHLGAFQRSGRFQIANLVLPVPRPEDRPPDAPTPSPPEGIPENRGWTLSALRGFAKLHAALYVVSRDSEPTWSQLVMQYWHPAIGRHPSSNLPDSHLYLSEPLTADAPAVGLDPSR
jgi:hypothetical protein